MSVMDAPRYHRQMLLPGIGAEGQRRLGESHALVVGCGALGTHISDALARAGVGRLTIVDRDVVELTNLQRQVLYDEADADAGTPKAAAAEARLRRINSAISVQAHVDDFNHRTALRYVQGVDILLDGLDNFEARYLLNDVAVSRGLPFVYGGAVAATGASLTVLPHSAKRVMDGESKVRWSDEQATPCLRCVFPEAPPAGSMPTCDTAGVLGPVVAQVAAHQAVQAIKLLTGNIQAVDRSLLSIDAWTNETRRFDIAGARDGASCACCALGRFDFLNGDSGSAAISLCGRHAVQITPGRSDVLLDLKALAAALGAHGRFACTPLMLRGTFSNERGDQGEPLELTLFPNGRAIIKGTTALDTARSMYARYVGA